MINSHRPSYHSLGSCALSPQLQYMLLLGEGATLMAKVYTVHMYSYIIHSWIYMAFLGKGSNRIR